MCSHRVLWALSVAMSLLLMPSCIMTKDEGEQMKQEMLTTNAQLDSLEKDYQFKSGDLDERFVEMKRELEQLKKHSQLTTATDHVELDRIRRDILMLTGMIENQGFEAQQEMLKVKDILEDLKQRVNIVEAKLGISDSKKSKDKGKTKIKGGAATSPSAVSDDPKSLYRQARKLLKEKSTIESRRMFALFLTKYPKHRLADDSQYWIGESYLREKNFHQAVMEFQKVLDKYKKTGDMQAPALTKMGDCFRMLGMFSDAKLFYEEAISQYSKSRSAERARKALKKMK